MKEQLMVGQLSELITEPPLEIGSRNNYGVFHVIQADSYVESSHTPRENTLKTTKTSGP